MKQNRTYGVLLSGSFLSLVACSTTNHAATSLTVKRPLLASTENLSSGGEQATDEDDSAAGFLERGFTAFNTEDFREAVRYFGAALGTSNLNDAGRVLAYWHIFVSESNLNHEDQSVEALASFISVAQDVIAQREEVRFAVTDAGDFVERFSLTTRLMQARAHLSAAWAARRSEFGRTTSQAVPVFSRAERDYFLDLVLPCNEPSHRDFVPHNFTASHAPVEEVHATCESSGIEISFYFDYIR